MAQLYKPEFNPGELIVGLASPVGVDLDAVCAEIVKEFRGYGWRVVCIHLSQLLRELMGSDRSKSLPANRNSPEYYRSYMAAGNSFRGLAGGNDALALLSLSHLRSARQELTGDSTEPAAHTVYVLRSLKTPEEVDALRRIYGENFVLVSCYGGRSKRREELARSFSGGYPKSRNNEYAQADHVIDHDETEEDSDPHGQNLRSTFHLGDFFVDPFDQGFRTELRRIVEILLGHPFHTPSPDECAMYHAHAAALRSSSMARQVGCAISSDRGDLIAAGTNEVPHPKGGLVWYGDAEEEDTRDHKIGAPASMSLRRTLIGDLLQRLGDAGWLQKEQKEKVKSNLDDLVDDALTAEGGPLAPSEVSSLIEFSREVHAEMAAIIDAARRGVSVACAKLYTTTFPCHDCAKHIVAAGISEVRYIAPYPKSRVAQLYPELVDVDGERNVGVPFRQFLGVGPRMYPKIFAMAVRRDHDGQPIDWQKKWPKNLRFGGGPMIYLPKEQEALSEFDKRAGSRIRG